MRKSWFLAAPALCALAFLGACSNTVTRSGSSFLYVASGSEPIVAQPNLTGFRIAANGSLTLLPCPAMTNADVYTLVGGGNLLFSSSPDNLSVYSVDQNGCLARMSVTNEDLETDLNGCLSNCFAAGPDALFLDSEHQNLYSWNYLDVNGARFVSYSVDSAKGSVTRTSDAESRGYPAYPAGMLAFSPDNRYAVSGASTYLTGSSGIPVYERRSDGTLNYLKDAPSPAVGDSLAFIPNGAAADSAGHFIVAGQISTTDWGPWRLAIYTMDSSGNMATRSTAQNMAAPPAVNTDTQTDLVGYSFSPDSRYFAIANPVAIDVYSWDTANATLRYITAIHPPHAIPPNQHWPFLDAFAWDRFDHVIATWGGWAETSAEIDVYTLTPSGISVSPGSPYPLPAANKLTVVNRDR